MNVVRKIRKSVNEYINLLNTNNEKIKENCQIYLQDISFIEQMANNYFTFIDDEFQKWCDLCVQNFAIQELNIKSIIVKKVNEIIINYHLNKYSYEMYEIGTLQGLLKKIKIRLEQYKYLLSIQNSR